MGIVFALLSMLCFAANIFISRAAMSRMSPDIGFPVVLLVNIVFASLVFGAELLLTGAPFAFQARAAGWFVLSGVMGNYLGRRMLYDAVHVLGPARASLLHTTSPIVTLIAAWLLLGEALGVYELLLMALVIAGLMATQMQPAALSSPSRVRASVRKAMTLSALTVIGFGLAHALRGMAMREWNEAAFGAVLGAAAALLCQLATGTRVQATVAELRKGDQKAVRLYVASGVATVCGTMFSAMAMQRIEVAVATLVTHATPLVVFPVSVFVLKNREGLNAHTVAGALVVLLGITLLALR